MWTVCYHIWSLVAAGAAKSEDLNFCISEEFLILSKLLVVKKKQKVFVYVSGMIVHKNSLVGSTFVLRMLRHQE